MPKIHKIGFLAPCLTALAVLAAVRPASAQYLLLTPTQVGTVEEQRDPSSPTDTRNRPSLIKPFSDAIGDLRRLPTRDNLGWLVIGMAAAAGSHGVDGAITRDFTRLKRETFRPGAIVGGTPLELGAAFALYAIGRGTNSNRGMKLGAELIRAQLLAELMTTGVKQAVRRSRPEGSGFSFPSGHTAVTFASATVLQREFGWKAGIPAYAVASYVAASRVQMKRHYLSDVAFGAAVGIVAGRTVSIGGHQLMVAPLATPGGGGAALTWLGRK